MSVRLDAQVSRVQLVSRWMHWSFKAVSGLFVVAFLFFSFGGHLSNVYFGSGTSVDLGTSSWGQVVLVSIVIAARAYYGWRVPWHIAGLFRCFEEREIFTARSIQEIFAIGRSLFFFGVAGIVSVFVGVLLETHPFSTHVDLTPFVGGAFVMLLAWIFETGRKLQDVEARSS